MGSSKTVAAAVVSLLADAGVRHAYTVPGESFLGLLDAFDDESAPRLVSARHESGAAFMACGEARLTGTPAVVLASRGPGAANLSIGVHTAHQDRVPLVALVGQVESGRRGRGGLQEVDLTAFLGPISTWAAEARHADDVPGLVAEALTRATTGARGPAIVAVPADYWDQPFDRPVPGWTPARTGPVPDSVAGVLAAARHPVVIAGAPAWPVAGDLVDVAERLGLGVYSAFRQQGVFPEDHPCYLGHLGISAPAPVVAALEQADTVLLLDSRLDPVTAQGRFPRHGQHLVQVAPGACPPVGIASPVTCVDGDVGAVLALLGAMSRVDRATAHRAVRDFIRVDDTAAYPAKVIAALRRLLPTPAVITTDAGSFTDFVHRHGDFSSGHRLIGSPNGAMGFGVPAAIGAKLARPDHTVVATVGDGGALMTGQEIETAVRTDAPITVLVFRNGLYGTIAAHQASTYQRLKAVDIGPVDFAGWARSLGADAFTLREPDDPEPVLAAALTGRTTTVIDVMVPPDTLNSTTRLSDLLG